MSEKNPKFDPERADALNPNNKSFWLARGFSDRPSDWKKRLDSMELRPTKSIKRAPKREARDFEKYGYPDCSYAWCKDDY